MSHDQARGSMVEGFNPPAALNVDEQRYVQKCVDVIMRLARLYGFDDTGYSLRGTVNHWIYCASFVGDSLKFVKWKIAAFYSSWKNQNVNDDFKLIALGLDNPKILLGGRAYSYFNKILARTDSRAWESFITSVLYSKKGMPRPEKWRIRMAERKTYGQLTNFVVPPPSVFVNGDWGRDIPSKVVTKLDFMVELIRTTEEIFKGHSMTPDDYLEPFCPSTSANYFRSRNMAGALGAILDDPELMEGLRVSDSLLDYEEKQIGKKRKYAFLDDTRLRIHWEKLYSRICGKALLEHSLATPLGLAEALKVRVITKGPPFLYTALKPIQKFLWRTLKDHPFFRLVGTPVTADYVQERLGAKLGPGEKFLSVDYTDATNQMAKFASDTVVDTLSKCLHLPEGFETMFKRSLTGHTMEILKDDTNSTVFLRKKQLSGQLMGSITSFPVLCIINAAILRATYELSTGRRCGLKNVPGCVNGDDGVLRIGPDGEDVWTKISSLAGLTPSVGKVYFSEEFLNINSTTYNYHPIGYESYTYQRYETTTSTSKVGSSTDLPMKSPCREIRRTRHFQLVPYVNMGLLLGLKRSGGPMTAEDTGYGKSIGAVAKCLIDTCPPFLQEVVLQSFINNNKNVLQKYKLPWFIPESYGGLGLPLIGRFFPRDIDLRLARLIYQRPDTLALPSRPQDGEWQMWRLATKLAPSVSSWARNSVSTGFDKSVDADFQLLSYKQMVSRYVLDTLFRFQITELLKQGVQQSSQISQYMRSLSRTWHKALTSGIPIPEPFRMDNLPPIIQEDDVPFIFYHIDRRIVATEIHVASDATVNMDIFPRFQDPDLALQI